MRVTILGVPIDPITQDQAIRDICQAAHRHQKLTVATVNPEFIMAAQDNRQFLEILQRADLTLPDGIGILWAANVLTRFAGQSKINFVKKWTIGFYYGIKTLLSLKFRTANIPQQVSGSNLVFGLADQAAQQKLSIFLLGGAPGVAERAAQALQNQQPSLNIAGTFAGDASPRGDLQTRQAITSHPADIVLVAYGAPKQELWIDRNLSAIPASVAIGVGGTLDFLAGDSKRAPGWVQRLGFEWLFRLILEPWRWRRQLALPKFINAVINA